MEVDITYIAHIKTAGKEEQIVDLAIPELTDFRLGRENKTVELLKDLGQTNIERPTVKDIATFVETSTFEGQEVTTEIHYTTALKAGSIGSESGNQYYELTQLQNVVQ